MAIESNFISTANDVFLNFRINLIAFSMATSSRHFDIGFALFIGSIFQSHLLRDAYKRKNAQMVARTMKDETKGF